MSNMKSVIQNYKPNFLSKHTTPVAVHSISYCKKSECLLDNECLSESLILRQAASQTPSLTSKYDYGTCAKTFKEEYNNHTATFRNNTKQKSTELSKCIWELKQSSIQYQINLGIALTAHP